jgi:hypothetical protein
MTGQRRFPFHTRPPGSKAVWVVDNKRPAFGWAPVANYDLLWPCGAGQSP